MFLHAPRFLHRLTIPSAMVVCLAAPVLAQPVPPGSGAGRTITMDPTEVDSFACRFVGRTLAASGSQPASWITITDLTLPATDASPSGILTAQATSGSDASFTLAPSSRAGNSYEIRIRPLDSDNNRPLCVLRLNVRDASLLP